jgi:hypothetical protein
MQQKMILFKVQNNTLSVSEWTRLWMTYPELANYIGEVIRHNINHPPRFAQEDASITQIVINPTLRQLTFDEEMSFFSIDLWGKIQ